MDYLKAVKTWAVLVLLISSISIGFFLNSYAEAFSIDYGSAGDDDPPVSNDPEKDCSLAEMVDLECDCYSLKAGGYPWTPEQLLDLAIEECAGEYFLCILTQTMEMKGNENRCQSIPGCQFTYGDVDKKQCEGTVDDNCKWSIPEEEPLQSSNSELGEEDASGNKHFTCVVRGRYNITDYKCARPEETDPVGK